MYVGGEIEREREREIARDSMCMCMCVCVRLYICMCVSMFYMHVCVCNHARSSVCLCVCVWEREREKYIEIDRGSVCVCMCVYQHKSLTIHYRVCISFIQKPFMSLIHTFWIWLAPFASFDRVRSKCGCVFGMIYTLPLNTRFCWLSTFPLRKKYQIYYVCLLRIKHN